MNEFKELTETNTHAYTCSSQKHLHKITYSEKTFKCKNKKLKSKKPLYQSASHLLMYCSILTIVATFFNTDKDNEKILKGCFNR